MEKKYLQELAIESVNAKRDNKVKQERAEQENLSDELRENVMNC